MKNYYHKKNADKLHHSPSSNTHPADTYFHFSFADYFDPDNMNYGVLRVLNDDKIKPFNGFGKHPHANMEIVTYIIDGKLTHWDSAHQKKEVMERGEVQIISAGDGVMHSEINEHEDWVHLLQMWILPPKKGLDVRYENHKFTEKDRQNKLLHIVGNINDKKDAPLYLSQNINMYVSELTKAKSCVEYALKENRQAYIYNFEGEVVLAFDGEEVSLNERDSLQINAASKILFKPKSEHAHFIIIEMPKEN